MPGFEEWESFYVIVGAAAGALIGVQFVVMTLIAENPPVRVQEAGAAFATPTVVHFGAALLISALLRVPFETILPAASLWGLVGAAGLVYTVIVVRRMKRQTSYRPDLEDWAWHACAPLGGYGLLLLSALPAASHATEALLGLATGTLLLLFIGIHNAWDAIAWHVFVNLRKKDE